MQVVKRSGKLVPYDPNRILRAVRKCGENSGSTCPEDLAAAVLAVVEPQVTDGATVEQVQDYVEAALKDLDFAALRHYISYRDEHAKLREKRLTPDLSAIPEYVVRAKYARYLPDRMRRENWNELCDRTEAMHMEKYPFLADDIVAPLQAMRDKLILPSMRTAQFGGQAMLRDNARGYNCTASYIDRPEFFKEALYLLLCGCGVGYSAQKQDVAKLPTLARVDETLVKHFTIPDTKEGWAESVDELIQSFIQGYHVEFNYSKIRPRNTPLKTSGGRAPGHLKLKAVLETGRQILAGAQGRKLRPFEAHLLMCTLADAVLSGGVRRSALISIFSADDDEMLTCKTGEWYKKYPQLGNSNNSAAMLRTKEEAELRADFDRVGTTLREFAEPGFYWTYNLAFVPNPCCEIGMLPKFVYEGTSPEILKVISRNLGLSQKQLKAMEGKSGWAFCNLTSINVAACDTPEKFFHACEMASILGTLQAGYTKFPYLGKVTEAIALREALLGVSMTGILNHPEIALVPEILERGVQIIREANIEWAAKIGINPAARLTAIKPEGTGTLTLWNNEWGLVGSGISPIPAKLYIRRITAKDTEPLFLFFKKYNPHMVIQTDPTTYQIEFPVLSDAPITKQNLDPEEYLRNIQLLQKHWVTAGTARPESAPGLTHSVSNTVFVGPEEWDSALDFIWKNRYDLVGLTLAKRDLDKMFQYPPESPVRTAADEAHWNDLIRDYVPVPWDEMVEVDDQTTLQNELACAGGACTLV